MAADLIMLNPEVYRQLASETAPFDTRASRFLLTGRSVLAYCFASMSFQQAHQYFSAVWADGFPRSRHHAVSDVR
ncbi:hypothetical protein [Bifidobacterium sp.]|uniref:hypothetical protein n=1 Tax=Bifidobacterium sp. TaxID=41200 RepID=UPI003865A218